MSATPSPWNPAVEQLLRSTLQQRWSVVLYDAAGAVIPGVEVSTCEVTIDLAWSPYAQATLTGPVPEDQAVLDALDPRKLVKVVISAGYVLPGGIEDVHPLAVLFLRVRDVNRPENTLTMQAQGAEWLYDAWVPHEPGELVPAPGLQLPGFGPNVKANDGVLHCLRKMTGRPDTAAPSTIPPAGFAYDAAPETTGWGYDSPPTFPETPTSHYVPAPGQDAMSFLREIAARVDAWMYCDELGVWRLVYPPGLSSQSAVQLNVGATGVVLDSTTTMSRDEWANDVLIRWVWQEGDEVSTITREIRGAAWISSGPYARDLARRTTLYEDRTTAVGQFAATSAARRLLRRRAPYGRTIQTTAVAAYWLRPYDTVTVELPTGPQERHQVQQVAYQLDVGTMRVTTRQPIDDSTITGG